MKSVVIDTNVIVSALLFGGKPGKLIQLWKAGQIQPLISKEITEEYLRVLAYPKFNLSENDIGFLAPVDPFLLSPPAGTLRRSIEMQHSTLGSVPPPSVRLLHSIPHSATRLAHG